jgi:hypothetical protein
VSSTDSAEPADTGVTPDSPADQDVVADSSPAEGVENTYLEAINKVFDKEGAEESPASEKGEGKPSPSPIKDVKAEDADPSEDELKRYPPNSQKRIRQLLSQRDDIKERFEAEKSALTPKAEHLDRITGYMQAHNIEPQEFDNTLEITRMFKAGQFEELLPILTPIYLEVAKRAGKVLPSDLREEVRLGHMPEARARELHEARTRSENLTARQEEERTRNEQRNQGEQIRRIVHAAATTADEWAKAKGTSDPDWSLKQEDVAAEVERIVLKDPTRYPKSREQVVALSEEALKTVEGRIKRFAPRPTERRVPRSQPPSPRSAAAPKSYMEAVDMALAGSGKS